jgi:hypothetical protein
MKSSLRVAALLSAACWIALALRVEAGLNFVHLTDPHLFGKAPENEKAERALRDCVEEINRRVGDGNDYKFVAVTGDLGIEDLVSDKGTEGRDVHAMAAEDRSRGAAEFAKIVGACAVKKWLFLPGNNDLIDEAPASLVHYTEFVKIVRDQLKGNGFEIVDLTPREKDDNSGIDREGPYTFVGFNNASFKSNNSSTNAKDPVWIKSHRDAVAEVTKRIQGEKNVYVLFHIPEVDDPYYVLDENGKRELDQWIKKRDVFASPFKLSAWTVPDDVRKAWEKIVAEGQVKGLFAGHFHDWRRDTYRNFLWLVTPAYGSGTLLKLHICPPLSEKRQEGRRPEQARGFQLVHLDDDGKPSVQIVWYNDALFSNEQPPRGNGPLLEKTITLSVDPTAHTASGIAQLFNGTRDQMKVALSASDFISTTTKRSIGGRVTFAGPGQTAGQQLYETTVPVGAVVPVRIEATGLWEAGESIGQILDHGAAIGTLRALKSRPPFSIKLAGEKPEINFVQGEWQRIALHNDDAMTYRAIARVAFGNLLSDAVPVDLPPGGDAYFEIQLPDKWFSFSSAFRRQIIDGEIILAFDAPAAVSAPDLPRRRIPFKGSLNWLGASGQGSLSYLIIILTLFAGGGVAWLMSNYFPNQARRGALADQIDEIRTEVDALPTTVDSEFRALLRVNCHHLRSCLTGDWMISAEASARLDTTAAQIDLLHKKTDLVTKFHRLTERLEPFNEDVEKDTTDIGPLFKTVEQARELLRAPHPTGAELESAAQNVQKGIDGFASRDPKPGGAAEPTREEIFEKFKSQPLSIMMDPTSPNPYQVVTLTAKFADGTPPYKKVKCGWQCGDGLTESGWKIFHYFATARLPPPAPPPAGGHVTSELNVTVVANFELSGERIPIRDKNEITQSFPIRPAPPTESRGRNQAELWRLVLALTIALIGLLATAQEQLAKFDFFAAVVAVFLLGFTANAVKDIFAPKTAKT